MKHDQGSSLLVSACGSHREMICNSFKVFIDLDHENTMPHEFQRNPSPWSMICHANMPFGRCLAC